MKKSLCLLSFCMILLGARSEEKKVITDADILRVNNSYMYSPTSSSDGAGALNIAEYEPIFTTAYDPFVTVAKGRDKANRRDGTYTSKVTGSEISTTVVNAAVQDCEFYTNYNSSNYGNPKRPDHTGCKHGHHTVKVVMVLGDGKTYTGSADYQSTYTGHQLPRKYYGDAAGNPIPGLETERDPYAPWYLEHTITQHINFATFAKSANISTNEMVKRILYYGIRSIQANGRECAGAESIRRALFYCAGYQAKLDATLKKEISAGKADWNAAKSEMKKKKPDFDKASRLFISGSKHLNSVRKFEEDKIDEIHLLFRNFTEPMFNLEPYDTTYMRKIVQVYVKTMESVETPISTDYERLDKVAPALITKLWYDMRDYNPEFFETYNRLYDMPDDSEHTISNSLKLHREVFKKCMKQYATSNPEGINQAIANYMHNPMKGDGYITDTLIIAKAKAESVLAKEQLEKGDFDILYMFRNAPDTAMWNRSEFMHDGYIMNDLFEEYYVIVNQSILHVFDTLCTMIINGDAPKVSMICHTQFDPIFGANDGEDVYRYDLFHYYYNSYRRAKIIAQCIENAADKNLKADAEYLQKALDIPRGRNFVEDFRMGHVINRKTLSEEERSEIRNRITNVHKLVDVCKKAADFDTKNDFLVVVETGDQPFANFEFGVGMKDKFIPIKEVYIDGKLVKIKPKKHTKKWQQKQWLYKYKGTLQPLDNNNFHCFIFKGKEGMSGFGEKPFLFDRYKIPNYYWLEYPSSAKGNSDNPVDKIYEQRYLKLVIH